MKTVPCTLIASDDMELITKKKADRHWMIQSLTGDSTDNFKGLIGCGPVTADKILGDAKTLPDMWDKVVEAYEKKKQTFADAILTARLSRILREGDFNYKTKEVELWTP
jgi:DNA polymerase-1